MDEKNVYLYVGGARDFWYEKSGAWVKNVGKHWCRVQRKDRQRAKDLMLTLGLNETRSVGHDSMCCMDMC